MAVAEGPAQRQPGRGLAALHVHRRIVREVLQVDRVRVRAQPVPLGAQARHHREVLAEADLVLPEQRRALGVGVGEIAHRQVLAQDHLAGLAGAQVGFQAIAQAFVAGVGQVHAVHVPVLHPRPFVPGLAQQRQPGRIGGVVEAAPAQRFERGGAVGQPVLVAVLADVGALPVQLCLQRLHPGPAGRPFTGQAGAAAALAVVGVQAIGGVETAAAETQRVDLGLPRRVAGINGERVAPGAIGVAAGHLGQHRTPGVVGRIGAVLGTPGAVAGLVPAPLGGHHHRLPAARRFAGPARRGQETVVDIVVTQPRAQILRAARARQQRLRIQGTERDHAGQRIAAVQGRGRAALDLHPFHRLQVDQVAAGRGELADAVVVGQGDAVDQDPHPVALQAADGEAARTPAMAVCHHRHPGHVAHQAGRVAHQAPVQLLAFDLGHAGHDLADRFRCPAGHHHHRVQGGDRAAAGGQVHVSGGGGGGGGGRSSDGDQQGRGEDGGGHGSRCVGGVEKHYRLPRGVMDSR